MGGSYPLVIVLVNDLSHFSLKIQNGATSHQKQGYQPGDANRR